LSANAVASLEGCTSPRVSFCERKKVAANHAAVFAVRWDWKNLGEAMQYVRGKHRNERRQQVSKRTIDATGRDELKEKTPEARKIQRLEMSLRVIRTRAACWSPAHESPQKAMDDIKRKCDEALK